MFLYVCVSVCVCDFCPRLNIQSFRTYVQSSLLPSITLIGYEARRFCECKYAPRALRTFNVNYSSCSAIHLTNQAREIIS